LTPYQQHEKVVIEGSVEDCAKALPVKNDRADLSVLLNVAWFLDNAATWERKNGAPHDLVKAPVVQLELKRRLFDERIDRCVAQLHHSLNADAQIALDALRSQLLEGRNFGLASVGSIPDWGTHPLCDTEWFLAPDEQDMLMDPPSDDESEIGPNGSRHPAVSDVLG